MLIAPEDTAALRRFGWQMSLAWPLLFGLLLPWLFDSTWPYWPWYLGVAWALCAVLVPPLLYWPSRLWFAFAHLMGWLNTRLILAVVFFVVLMPLGWLLRVLGKLDYRPERCGSDSSSYWQQSDNISADNMKDPF